MKPNWQLSLFAIVSCIILHYSTLGRPLLDLFGQVSWVLVVAFFVWRYRLDPAESLGWRLPAWRDWGLAIVIPFAMIWIVVVALDIQHALLPEMDDVALKREIETIKEQGAAWAILGAAVWAAIREELVFRGIGLRGMARSWGPWLGLAASSLLFGLAHASLGRLVPTVLLGAGYGLVALGSRSLFPAVLAHMLNNVVALYFMDAIRSSALKAPLCFVSLLVIALSVLYIRSPRGEADGRP